MEFLSWFFAILLAVIFGAIGIFCIFEGDSLGEDHFSEEEDDSQTGR